MPCNTPINRVMPKRTQDEFVAYLRFGKAWEWKAFEFLKERFPTLRPPLTLEEAVSLGPNAVDERPDMEFGGYAIECKRRQFDFTGPKDFPYQTFYVDEEYKLRDKTVSKDKYYGMPMIERRSHIRPFLCYLTANRDMTHMGLVIPASKGYWTLERRRLSADGRNGDSWGCQLNKVLFMPVAEWRQILTWV